MIGAADASSRHGVSERLVLEPGLRVVGVAEELAGLLRLTREREPDVVVVDVRLARSEAEMIASLGSDRAFGIVLLADRPSSHPASPSGERVVRVRTDAPLSALLRAIRLAGTGRANTGDA